MSGSPSDAGEPDLLVDARGRRCPLPVIDLARALAKVDPGGLIDVLTDDPAAATDIPAWCRMRGQGYLGFAPIEGGAAMAHRVRRLS
ncbi:MAG TPA: sulfurtransferase TusA family protein [Frankiaceae bacterium]|nr:sulfurtransferase TusA family protein [Frankiaceae bacterium]